MAILLKFRKVSAFKDLPYGLTSLSFEIERGRTYHLQTDSAEKLNLIASLIEGRLRNDSGLIERRDKLFLQSDRLLLGDKVYAQEAGKWLSLKNDLFHFENRRRSKYGFIQILKAKHIIDYPIYKLHQEDKTKFALLAMAFQESGIILISRLLTMDLDQYLADFLIRIIHHTHTTCCLLTEPQSLNPDFQPRLPEMITLDLTA